MTQIRSRIHALGATHEAWSRTYRNIPHVCYIAYIDDITYIDGIARVRTGIANVDHEAGIRPTVDRKSGVCSSIHEEPRVHSRKAGIRSSIDRETRINRG